MKVQTLDKITLDSGSGTTIQQQIYGQVRAAIIDGKLRPGERVPSTRSLAAQLNIARGTVDLAYARLAEEGYIVTRGQRGTIVCPELTPDAVPARQPEMSCQSQAHVIEQAPLPFRFGLPALDLFPRKTWAKLAARATRSVASESLYYPDVIGLPALRVAITSYLAMARGIACRPEQVVVTTGYQAGLNLVARLLLHPGDEVWLEDPGYGFAQQALRALSMRIAPVPVDEQGLCVSYGCSRFPHAPLAIVTPAHQFPMGCTMSLSRRQALLAWAASRSSWILEDDYDCEFHYSGHRPPALKSIDRADRVFYAGSFSKTLFPGLRLGYLVVPLSFVDSAREACRTLHRGAAVLEQSIVAAFMQEGHFARHLRRMRVHYQARRQALVGELAKVFGNRIVLDLQPGGLHVLARFPSAAPDVELADRAMRHGLMPSPLSGQTLEHDAGQGLLLSFTNIPEQDASRISTALYRAITRI